MERQRVSAGDTSCQFAAIVPVGPDAVGLWRGAELIRSLLFWEPALSVCVLLDDAPRPRGLSELADLPPTCRVKTLQTPSKAAGASWIGRLTGGIIQALHWIQTNADVEFVLRIDADALVIGPFARAVCARLRTEPAVGLLGTLGLSNRPAVRARENYACEPKLLQTTRVVLEHQKRSYNRDEATVEVSGVGSFNTRALRSFEMIRTHIHDAVLNGYGTNEFCQGGVNAISRKMLDRMAAHGYLASGDAWSALPFADDRVMAMYAHATATRLCDYSAMGEPFGVQFIGLPYPPSVLVERGHSLIHSVKNDPRYSEAEIRDFFRHWQIASNTLRLGTCTSRS